MALRKDVKGLGMPWEDQYGYVQAVNQYGYVQAVKVDNTIYVSGQLSHDDQGNMVGAAPLDDSGKIRDHSKMETQMRQTSPATGAALVESAERHFGSLDKFDSGTRWPSFTTQGCGR